MINEYFVTGELSQALQVMADNNTTPFAGGTDLMPQLQSKQIEHPTRLLNLSHLKECQGIDIGEEIHIGSLTSISQIRNHPELKEKAKVLVEAADQFASEQVRNSATLGGNLCNASPASDMAIPLLLLDAEVELLSWQNNQVTKRKLPLCHFFTGPGKHKMANNEILSSIIFTQKNAMKTSRFLKFGVRPALEISVVSIGLAARIENEKLFDVRVALGAVAPTPLRARKVEALLEGKSLDAQLIKQACKETLSEASPISDTRASAWYRKQLLNILMERTLSNGFS